MLEAYSKNVTIPANSSVPFRNVSTTAQVQKVLDAIAGNKIDALQQKVNELQLREAMNGVVRYPNQFAYNAGSNPFCGCGGCGC